MAKPRVTTEQAKRLLMKKRLRELQAKDAAEQVREALLRVVLDGTIPDVNPLLLRRAKTAKPYGEFPSHRTLILIFEPELQG